MPQYVWDDPTATPTPESFGVKAWQRDIEKDMGKVGTIREALLAVFGFPPMYVGKKHLAPHILVDVFIFCCRGCGEYHENYPRGFESVLYCTKEPYPAKSPS